MIANYHKRTSHSKYTNNNTRKSFRMSLEEISPGMSFIEKRNMASVWIKINVKFFYRKKLLKRTLKENRKENLLRI